MELELEHFGLNVMYIGPIAAELLPKKTISTLIFDLVKCCRAIEGPSTL